MSGWLNRMVVAMAGAILLTASMALAQSDPPPVDRSASKAARARAEYQAARAKTRLAMEQREARAARGGGCVGAGRSTGGSVGGAIRSSGSS